jgi:hypothetical protein
MFLNVDFNTSCISIETFNDFRASESFDHFSV